MSLKKLLEGAKNQVHVDAFIAYCTQARAARNKKTGMPSNPQFQKITADKLAEMYFKVESQGLVFDGKHVSYQTTGISYDYIARKNLMLIAYPESIIDLDLVYEGDTFLTSKESGRVIYEHKQADVFNRTEKGIIGGYCVIKNKRGEFLTVLSLNDLEKHRKVAKNDYIWKNWLVEMYKKTIAKKAFKIHFEDIFEEINEADNLEADLSKAVTEEYVRIERAINEADSVEELEAVKDDNAKYISKNPKLNKLYINTKQAFEL